MRTEAKLAFRQLRREMRVSEYLILTLALVLSVAAVTSVGFFANRIERAIESQAATLLAADAIVSSALPVPEIVRRTAAQHSLTGTDVIQFPSVVLNEDGDSTLVAVKAVGNKYPLRGELLLSDELYGAEHSADAGGPAAGNVWVDSRLAGALTISPGDELSLGDIQVVVSRFIAFEPDRGGGVFQMAPRLMMSADDIPRSALLNEGSRARYKLLVAGEPSGLDDFASWLESHDDANIKFQTVEQGRPAVRSALLNVRRFLGLAAAVAVLLSGAAVALSARQIAERDMDTSALLRAFGAGSRSVIRIVLIRLAAIAVIASLVGSAIGFAAQFGLAAMLASWFATELPPPSLLPLIGGISCALLALGGFCLPAVAKAADSPVVRVLRRDLPVARPSTWLVVGSALLAMLVLLIWLTRDVFLGLVLVAGLVAVVGLLWLVSRLLVALAARTRVPALRRALEGIRRRPDSVSLQIAAFSVGLLALMLLAIVRTDVLNTWQRQIPANAPNYFMVNIQPAEVESMRELLKEKGIDGEVLYPMVRGRLEAINDRPIGEDGYKNDRARRMSERDYNLSYQAAARDDNTVVEGQWWPEDTKENLFSVEEEFAREVGINMGDVLHFRIADKAVSGTVSNFREVEWESFAVNFFVVGTPAALREQPASFVTSVHVEDAGGDFVRDVVSRFPGVTVLDIGSIIKRVTGILDRAALAVQYVFGFTLIAGALVLIAAVLASRRERFQEAAVLRTLGASRRYLAGSVSREFILIGALAGLMASSIAAIMAWVIVERVMSLDYQFNGWLWSIGVVAGIAGIWLAGTLATLPVLRQSPMAVIRSQV
ncbi:hypothetical protein AB833_32440 [Chromatiales bacterium (ex Bugula neritina AB1)]|nr:hypothetical protein AB833_32440 [Chromatiales bacterium (ex Bugula neritina AB1)]